MQQLVLICVESPLRLILSRPLELIGRARDCWFRIDDLSVSRRHAEVRGTACGFVLSDLGSRNGTFVDNKRIESCPIRAGQTLRFGMVSFLAALENTACSCDEPITPDPEIRLFGKPLF